MTLHPSPVKKDKKSAVASQVKAMSIKSVLYPLTRSDNNAKGNKKRQRRGKVRHVAKESCQSSMACVGGLLSLAGLEEVVHVPGNLEPAFLTVRSIAHADSTLIGCSIWIPLVCGG